MGLEWKHRIIKMLGSIFLLLPSSFSFQLLVWLCKYQPLPPGLIEIEGLGESALLHKHPPSVVFFLFKGQLALEIYGAVWLSR